MAPGWAVTGPAPPLGGVARQRETNAAGKGGGGVVLHPRHGAPWPGILNGPCRWPNAPGSALSWRWRTHGGALPAGRRPHGGGFHALAHRVERGAFGWRADPRREAAAAGEADGSTFASPPRRTSAPPRGQGQRSTAYGADGSGSQFRPIQNDKTPASPAARTGRRPLRAAAEARPADFQPASGPPGPALRAPLPATRQPKVASACRIPAEPPPAGARGHSAGGGERSGG